MPNELREYIFTHLRRPGDVPLTAEKIGEYVGRPFPDVTAEALAALLEGLVKSRRLLLKPGQDYSWHWYGKLDDVRYYCAPEMFQRYQDLESEEWHRQGIEDDAANNAFLILIQRHQDEWDQLVAEQVALLTESAA